MKKCFKCGVEKKLSDFYAHPKMADGRLNKCAECSKSERKKLVEEKSKDKNWAAELRESKRLWARRNKINSKSTMAHRRKWKEKFPEKEEAKKQSRRLLKKGFHKHHWSYLPEHYKDIIWLTPNNHKKAHRFLIYDLERFMYRRSDTLELLDTKENHNKYILMCIKTKPD